MSINWNEFEKPSGEFTKWKPENEGDTIAGVLKSIRIATMPDGNRYPSMSITVAGVDTDVLASQVQLLRLLAEKKPQPGDTIKITYTRLEKLAGNKTMKHFTVEVKPAQPITADDIL